MTPEEREREIAWMRAHMPPPGEPEHISVGGWLRHFPGEFEIVKTIDPVTGKPFDRIVRVKKSAESPEPAKAGP